MKFLHVRIKVRDLEHSIAFYTAHLGCRESGRKTSLRGSQLAFLHLPDSSTELELAHVPWEPDFDLGEDIFHLAFEVVDMPGTVERMRKAGVAITEEPVRTSSGSWMAFIADPDGYEIELLEHAH